MSAQAPARQGGESCWPAAPAHLRRPPDRWDAWRRCSARALALAPAAAVLVLACGWPLAWGVAPYDLLRYAAYLLAVVVAPGVVVWRAAGPDLRYASHELAMGAAVGVALETAVRVAASAAGSPAFVGAIAPPALALGLVAVPGTRARVRRPWSAVPRGSAWAQAAVVVTAMTWFAYAYFRTQPVTWTGRGGPENDLLFALGLAGEATHRWPLQFPWVSGEPLLYHWFFAEHLATATEVSGVDLATLLLRLDILPMVIVLALTTGALATRLAGRVAVAAPAAGLLLLVQDASPLGLGRLLRDGTADVTGVPYDVSLWWSTSGLYAAVVFAPVFLLLVDAVRRRARRGHWLLLALLLPVGAGAKASVLPVVLASVTLALVVEVVRHRRWHRPATLLCVATAGVFVLALWVLYGSQPQGLEVFPLRHVMTTSLGGWVLGSDAVGPSVLGALAVMVLVVASVGAPFWGLVLLMRRSGLAADPAMVACIGALVAGLGGLVLLYHPGQSNLYFLRTALPVLAAATVWVVHEVMRGRHVSRQVTRLAVVAAFLTGVVTMALLGLWGWVDPELSSSSGRLARAAVPWVLAAAMATATSLLLCRATGRGRRAQGVPALLLLAVFVAGTGTVRTATQTVGWILTTSPGSEVVAANPLQRLDADGVAAARWIRDHSDGRDEIVTNVFCANGPSTAVDVCDNRTFWVSAYSERRTVLSGWGYTATTNARAVQDGYANSWQYPFWDQGRLTRLRGFLAAPSQEQARALADEGARYVLVVPGFDAVSPSLARVLPEVHREGGVKVFRLG